jgi:plastocyanin
MRLVSTVAVIGSLVLTMPAAMLGAFESAAQPAGGQIEIVMSNYKFSPSTIHMRVGAPYALTLRNDAHGGHSFEAGAFFAAADLPSADRAKVENGKVEVAGGEQVTVSVAPTRPGSYRFHCTHSLHSMFGMTGTIVVD